jgi:hypothetical protein
MPETPDWVWGLLERKPAKVGAGALANKTARLVWAVIVLAIEMITTPRDVTTKLLA